MASGTKGWGDRWLDKSGKRGREVAVDPVPIEGGRSRDIRKPSVRFDSFPLFETGMIAIRFPFPPGIGSVRFHVFLIG